jgi:hypothetical protein
VLGGGGKDVVGLLDLVERKVVGAELFGLDASVLGEPEKGRDRRPADQAGRDRDVLDPQLLEVQRGRRAVDADVGHGASRTHHTGAQIKRRGPPTASMATSTPSPSVRSRICCEASSPPATVCVAPKRSACLSRDRARSTAMIRAAPAISAVIIEAKPTGPAPTTATVSPGLTPPLCTRSHSRWAGCQRGTAPARR